MGKYLQVSISAENKPEALKILDALLGKKLITGGQIIEAPSRFLWKGKITDMNYCMSQSYTLEEFRDEIIAEVKKVTVEEIPFVTFLQIDGNQEFLDWIDQTLS